MQLDFIDALTLRRDVIIGLWERSRDVCVTDAEKTIIDNLFMQSIAELDKYIETMIQ